MPVCLARRALLAAATDPDRTLRVFAARQDAELFDALLERTRLQDHHGWQKLVDPFLSDPLTLRGLIALAPAGSARARALRAQLSALLIDEAEAGRLDYIDHLPRLQRLRVVSCQGVTGWEALVGHPALSTLELEHCGAEPADLDRLARTHLRTLRIVGRHPKAPALYRLDVVGEMPHLVALELSDLPDLSALPPLPELLEVLRLPASVAMPALPDTLRSLTIEDLPDEAITAPLPEGLVHLGLVRAAALTSLPVLPDLESATLEGCTALQDVTPLSAASGLRWLDLRGCEGVSDLSSLRDLPALAAVAIEGSGARRGALPVAVSGEGVDLVELAASWSPPVALPPLLRTALQQVRDLLRSGDTSLVQQALELIFSLDEPALYSALLRGCGVTASGELRLSGNLQPVTDDRREVARLRWAMLRLMASAPADLPECAFRHEATALSLDTPVLDLADLVAVFPRLEKLMLMMTKTWRHPERLGQLGALRELMLVRCVPPAGLVYPTGLRRLISDGDHRLVDLTAVSSLSALEELHLMHVDALFSLEGLPASVRSLSLFRARSLTDLSALSGHARLSHLRLSGCPSLHDLTGLEDLLLHHLEIANCPSVTSLAALRGCDALESVTLTDLSVRDLDGLQDATGLYTVSLVGLGVRDLGALCNAALLSVSLEHCTALSDVSALREQVSLQTVQVYGCPALKSLSGLPPVQSLDLFQSGVALTALPPVSELIWREQLSQAELEQLPMERIGALVLRPGNVDESALPDAVVGKIRWMA